ncbi:MAG: sensor histidine kinase, partial [Gemmatimonadaceae bacterium]
WMLATPPIFWLTSRLDAEDRQRQTLLYVIVGLSVAFAIDFLTEFARSQMPPPPFPVFAGGGLARRSLWSLTRGRYLNQCTISAAVITAGIARAYVARYRRRLEEAAQLRTELAEARLAMLRSQLNPHFLYNTLNAISAMVDRDPRGVRRMIARLSELLRSSLEPSAESETPLERELTTTDRYLEILRIRFQERLETSIDVDPGVRDALVPPMILQPLVENAMKHAVSKTARPSRIGVFARRDGESLVLGVRDSGGDPAHSPVIETNNGDGTGVGTGDGTRLGLRNTRARLNELYGDDCSLTLARCADGGVEALIRLPYHTASDLRAVPVSGEAAR